jgi:hypothetical protein
MKSRRGFIFPLYIVALTLLMCGTVIMLYLSQQDDLNSSLVSPLDVLEVRDDLEIFEMRELELIRGSLDDWDEDSFKASFIEGLSDEMKEFIFSDLIWGDKLMEGDFNRDTFLENILYSVSEDSGNFILKRAKIGKRFLLESEGDVDASFPVEFEFEFEREYLIRQSGRVEVVE